MSETLDPVATVVDQQQSAEQLLAQPQQQHVDLIGPNSLFNAVAHTSPTSWHHLQGHDVVPRLCGIVYANSERSMIDAAANVAPFESAVPRA